MSTLEELADRSAIADVMTRYALGVDLRDWTAYRSCFLDEFEIDAPGWPATMRADAWVERVREGIERFQATQHVMSNFSIELEGDEARSITYVRAVHHQPAASGDPRWTIVGYYRNTFARTSQGWKIRKFNLTFLWTEGNEALMAMGPGPPDTTA